MEPITQLPDPPSRSAPAQFSSKTDAFLGAMPAFVTQTNAVASEIAAAAVVAAEAIVSANVAAIAGTPTKWVSGTNYDEGAGVWSPINYLPYRRIVAGGGTTDPSEDYINWRALPQVPMFRIERVSNEEINPSNRGYFFDITGGTFSQTFSSKESLGNGFYCYILNSGTGVVTVDPGGLDYILYHGHSIIITCDGANLHVVVAAGRLLVHLPIFSQAAATKQPISILEDISLPEYSTLLSAANSLLYGNGLFIASYSTLDTDKISTSPDGVTWTLRTLPAAKKWRVSTNTTDKFIASATDETTVASSTDGITWNLATPLPGGITTSFNPPIFNGNICLVTASMSSLGLCYTSSNNGATWIAQTLPTTSSSSFAYFTVGGLFLMYRAGTTTAYTSPTGATGSWTTRTLPVIPSQGFMITHDNKLVLLSTTTDNYHYETTDSINWTSTGVVATSRRPHPGIVLNGVRTLFSPSPNSYDCGTYHDGKFVLRDNYINNTLLYHSFTNGSVICFLNTSTGKVIVFDPSAATQTAVFED